MLQDFYCGSVSCAVDDAGAVRLPEFVLATAARRSAATSILIGRHEFEPCLSAWDPTYTSTLYGELNRRRTVEEDKIGGAPDHHRRARQMFGPVEQVQWSSNGEMTIPPMARRKARITNIALFVGTGGMFEIWSPNVALESQDLTLQDIATWSLDHYVPRGGSEEFR